ncbi:cytochrome b [Methylobacterium sp. A54F]
MIADPPPGRLSLPTRLLHWTVALGILGMLAYGFRLQELPEGAVRGMAIRLHKSVGVVLLVLIVVRALWRWREGMPASSARHAPWERLAARTVHAALIAATLLMPLSGIARSLAYPRALSVFGVLLIPQPFATRPEMLYAGAAALHDGLALMLVGLVALHVAAALKHHFVDRDDTLRRMLGRRP